MTNCSHVHETMTIIDDYAVSPAILVTWLSAISNDIIGQDPGAS